MNHVDQVLAKLSRKSRHVHYNVYERFDWPDTIDQDRYWMSPELLSVHGSLPGHDLTESQLIELSKFEWLNFLAINIHGIKELMAQVVSRIHSNRFAFASEYFHHFLHEENAHMWFFAECSRRYGGKIYPNKSIGFGEKQEKEIEDFLTFSRILVIERIVGYYNGEMKNDDRLPQIIVDLNFVHFSDESRHLAMGHEIIQAFGDEVQNKFGKERLLRVIEGLEDYAQRCVLLLYNPSTYRDAGFEQALDFRSRLLKDPARIKYNNFLRNYALKDLKSVRKSAAT